MALKPRRSSFDAWAGRASSFDTSTMRANRPIPPPPVVEDVVEGVSSPVRVETQAQRPRRSRGRFFGLKFKLPLFGSKGDEKRTIGVGHSPKSETFWQRRQTTRDSSDNEKNKVRCLAAARRQILQESRAHSGACDLPDTNELNDDGMHPRPPSRLQGLPPPVYPGAVDFGVIAPVCVRNAQSLDVPSGERCKMEWHIGKAHELARVQDGSSRFQDKVTDTKSRWTQLASRGVFRVASRFRRKARGQRCVSQESHRPPVGCSSTELPPLYHPNQQAETDRRKSIGLCTGNSSGAYDTPGPEGPRCPPDNVYIPSGPPDSIYVCSGDTDRCLSLDSPMTYMPPPVADAYPLSGSTSMGSYPGRCSSESIFVQPLPLALWELPEHENKLYHSEPGFMSVDSMCPPYSDTGATLQPNLPLYNQKSLDMQLGGPMPGRCQIQGNLVPRRMGFEGLRPVQGACDVPAGLSQESQVEHSGGFRRTDLASGHSKAEKCKKNSIAKNIFANRSNDIGIERLSDVMEHPIALEPSVDSDLSLRPQTPMSEDSSMGNRSDLGSSCPDEEDVNTLCSAPDGVLCKQVTCLVDSLETWNPAIACKDMCPSHSGQESENESEIPRARSLGPTARPSISLLGPHGNAPLDWLDQHLQLPVDGHVTPSDRSLQVANHVELAASYTSDGPLYHRSMSFDVGFTSAEESDDDLDGSQRFTPSQFTLKLKKSSQHRRWHSDCLQGISAVHSVDEDDDYRSHSHYRLDRSNRLEEILSEYSRSFGDYPEEPGFSLRTGTDSDMILPEFDDINELTYGKQRASLDASKKAKKTWLDELQEGAELRRKECTYRIACQRAIMQSMKETMQASKLAFERLKSGLCPQLTAKVAQLRRRWGGKQRAKRREKLIRATKKDEDELLADIPLVTSGCGLLRGALK